jgi:hypothetical protein
MDMQKNQALFVRKSKKRGFYCLVFLRAKKNGAFIPFFLGPDRCHPDEMDGILSVASP